MLSELNVDYELKLVDRKNDAQKDAQYLALNPTGRIPTLIHGEQTIFESAAIGLYLCEQHVNANLLPAMGNPLRVQCYQWLFYLTSTVQSELMVYFYPEKHTTDSTHSPAIVLAQEKLISEGLKLLDQQIANKRFLMGDHITICDYFLFMMCHWASDLKRPPISFTNLGRLMRELASRESFRQVCEVEGTSLTIYD
jgi:glutathione S-transferase